MRCICPNLSADRLYDDKQVRRIDNNGCCLLVYVGCFVRMELSCHYRDVERQEMNIEELPEREYIINWFGIGSDLVKMLKGGLSPIQCMKRLRQTRLRERIIRCKDCKHCEKFYVCFSDKPLYSCNSGWHEGNEPIVKPDWFCACAESKYE